MKIITLLFLFSITLFNAQEIDELQEGYFWSENSKNFFRVDIKTPYDFYKVTSCGEDSQFIRAQFEGGDAAFNRELFKYISAYVDKEVYVVNGTFYLHIDIDSSGKITGLDITPKVANSEMFLKDLKFAVNRIKKNWLPAKCNELPVTSKIRIRLNFETESGDS